MNMLEKCTALMCVEVTAIVPPRQQALLRTAGSVGAAAYTEVVAQGRSTMHLEYTAPEGEECGPHVPVVLPFTTTEDDPFDDRSAVLVVSHDYLVANPTTSTLEDLSVHTSVKSVRYVVGGGVLKVGVRLGAAKSGGWSSRLESAKLCGFNDVVAVADFMWDCTSLTSIDLTPLRNVTNIGNNFMQHCTGLKTIDFSPMSKLTTVGEAMLDECCSLTSINLSFFKVTHIGAFFMALCSGFTEIDLSSFSSVTSIGHHFMFECSALQTVDLSALTCFTELTDGFMANCTSLTTINLSGLVNVNTIRNGFMHGCTSLESIDLRPLSVTNKVGKGFLGQCGRVTILHKKDIGPVLTEALPTSSTSWSGCTMA